MISSLLVAAWVGSVPAPAGVLTFDAAMKEARERNLDLKAAKARLEQADETSRKVWANYLPQLSVGGGYTRNSVETKLGLPTGYYIRDVMQPMGPGFDPNAEISVDNPPGLPTSLILYPSGFQEAILQPRHQWAGQVQLTQALIAPALWPAIHNASLGEQVAEHGVEAGRREVLFAVAQLYYGAASLKETLVVQERLLQLNREHELDAERRYQAGAAPKVELLRAQIDRAKSEQDLRRAKNGYEAAKSALATLLDRAPDFEVERPPEPARPSEEVLGKYEDSRPDLEMVRVSRELAVGLRRGTWFKFAPNVGLTAQYRLTNFKGFGGTYDSWAVTLGLNWTLWDGGLREAELRESAAKVVEAEASLLAARGKAADELRRARLELESAQANRAKSEETLKLARENAELVKVNYSAGAATYLQVSDANAALLGAELAAIAEALNTELAVLKLAKAAGAFDPT